MTILTRKDRDVGAGVFDSVKWAIEEHLREEDRGEYDCAILYGNEDAPFRIEFFCEKEPRWDTAPRRIWRAKL